MNEEELRAKALELELEVTDESSLEEIQAMIDNHETGKEKVKFDERQQAKIEEIKQEHGQKAVEAFLKSKGLSPEEIDTYLEQKESMKSEQEKKDEELRKLQEENLTLKQKEEQRQFNKTLKSQIDNAKDNEKVTKLLTSYKGLTPQSEDKDIKQAISELKEEFPELFDLVPEDTKGAKAEDKKKTGNVPWFMKKPEER
jgi:hypothetical protein